MKKLLIMIPQIINNIKRKENLLLIFQRIMKKNNYLQYDTKKNPFTIGGGQKIRKKKKYAYNEAKKRIRKK